MRTCYHLLSLSPLLGRHRAQQVFKEGDEGEEETSHPQNGEEEEQAVSEEAKEGGRERFR